MEYIHKISVFLLVMKKYKKIALFGALILVSGGYYFYHQLIQDKTEVSYVSAAAEKGGIVVSVSGTGQIASSNQIEVKSKASGDILSVKAVAGQKIKKGTVLVQLNASDALKSARDAEANLASAKLSLEKLKQPVEQLSLTQAENAIEQAKNVLLEAQEGKIDAEDDLENSYEDGFNDISNAFLDLPTVMAGLQNILFDDALNANQENISYYADAVKRYDETVLDYKDDADEKYEIARAAYDENFLNYKSISRSSSNSEIQKLLNETYETSKNISEAVKSANNLIQFYKDRLTERSLTSKSLADTHLSSLSTYTGETNTHISSLLSAKNTILSSKQAIINADRTIAEANRSLIEKEQSLADIKEGTDPLDIEAQELVIKQKESALRDAKEELADYSVRAPIDGVLAIVDAKAGDSASSGTAVATIITEQSLAEISLNEVDAAKIKVGQKATLTFSAIDELNLTGEVVEIDAVGTVSQGVVTYNAKISLDVPDSRVKPGMSVSASIIIESKQDVLLVSNSAIKSNENGSYVEILIDNMPQTRIVEIGLTDDTMTEIISGIYPGNIVITKTIFTSDSNLNSTQTQSTKTGSAGIPALGGFGR
jgi:RND family efflux transporter MFP subunit